MIPTNADTPLRRSEVSLLRDSATPLNNVTINDDEAERREARRRTILGSSNESSASTFEENETLKQCLELYNGNKMSRENAWSLSLIDTLSSLLERHHKSLNNFQVAGSSLEASSKVYGLRVDSVHTDVLRMSAGLNAQKFTERNEDDNDDDVATGGDGAADPNSSAATEGAAGAEKAAPKQKPKRQRRVVSTITKNKETLNARLDTVPLQDPVFGKLNSIVGSINSSNRLMNNILPTNESELRLRTTFRFWEADELESCDYTEPMPLEEDTVPDSELAACNRLFKVNFRDLKVRPLYEGYVISDKPEELPDDEDFPDADSADCAEMSMAFDMDAECEPMPLLTEQAPIVDVNYNDFDDLTTEERTAINNCRGLRKAPVIIEDLRPVDASSKLEYSYRPLDKITQFWAGPSHWKFKRTRPRSTFSAVEDTAEHRVRRTVSQHSKKRSKPLDFGEFHDDLFIKLDSKYKARKTNFQKKWDPRKLKLPTDLQLDPLMFFQFKFAPGLPVQPEENDQSIGAANVHAVSDVDDGAAHMSDAHFGDDDLGGGDDLAAGNFMHVSSVMDEANQINEDSAKKDDDADNIGNDTVLEIATHFDGAPNQVTKIVVPFAKRAKVIDMKSLKRCCTQLLNSEIKKPFEESTVPSHPTINDEHYVGGMASFQHIYDHLPDLLTPSMTEALSPSIAFYSVLHLANDFNLRLIQQPDLEDFNIRQLRD